MAILLQLSDVTKTFGAVRALKGVSFDLRAGEVHALLGENGAGKSTLIKLITGAHRPDGGRMEVDGKPVADLTPARAHELGIVGIYQQPALFPDLTVAENIGLRLEPPGRWRPVDRRGRRQRAAELLERLGASVDPESEVRSLSMPEQQLVEIACALGAGARVVIMDEPTASLTQAEQHRLYAIVRDLRRQGVGVVYISHRLEEIFALADRVTVLRDGESVGTRPVDEVNETQLIRWMVGREVEAEASSGGEAGDVVLEARGLGSREGRVQGIDLRLCAGEVVGLAGLVGAGRTEVARVLFGITPADAGELRLGGETVEIRSPAEAIGHGLAYVPEDRRRHGLVLEMPVGANVTLAILGRMFPGGWLNPAREDVVAAQYVRELEIKTSGTDAPGASLSGGNQQKVALARWLATQPRVLILDEPTQGVDVGAKVEIHAWIRRMADDGMAVLMISSDLPEVLGVSDRLLVMRGGRIVAEFPRGAAAPDVMAAALGKTQRAGEPEVGK